MTARAATLLICWSQNHDDPLTLMNLQLIKNHFRDIGQ
jgi:hypothetical protein